MIKMKNCGDFVAELTVSGSQVTTAGSPQAQTSAIVPFNARLACIFARLKVAGTTSTQYVDFAKNGVSITGSKYVLNFASATVVPYYTTASITTTVGNPPLFNKGDVISCVNTTCHSGTPANDLSIYLTLERQRIGTFNDPIATDTVGVDSDII